MTEFVNHPNHYTACGGEIGPDGTPKYEAIKVIESWSLGFCLGNAVKYLLRAPHKGTERQDLAKALWYLERNSDKATAFETPSFDPVAVATAWKLPEALKVVLVCIERERNTGKAAAHHLRRYLGDLK